MTRNLRIYRTSNTAKNVQEHWAGIQLGLQADACNRGAAVEADAIGRAAVEADTIGEQQPKRTRSGSAAEADAIEEQQLEANVNGEKQLKRTQSGGKWTQSGNSSSVQRAVRRRITHGRRTRGK